MTNEAEVGEAVGEKSEPHQAMSGRIYMDDYNPKGGRLFGLSPSQSNGVILLLLDGHFKCGARP